MKPAAFNPEPLGEDLKGRAARGGAAVLTAQAIKFGVNLGGIAVLSRLLSPGDVGLVAMITSFTGVVFMLKETGLSAATIQRPEISQAELSTLFWVNVAVSAVVTLLFVLGAGNIASFYEKPEVAPLVVAASAGFLFSGLGAQHQALLSRRMAFLRIVCVDVISVVAGTLLAISLAWAGWGVWSLAIMQPAISLLSTAGLWLASGWLPGRPSFARSTLSVLAFGTNMVGVHMLNYLARNVDNILIGRFCGARSLGIYFRAYQLLMLPLNQICGPIASVAVPAFSRLTNAPEQYRRVYLRVVEYMLMVAMPAMAFLLSGSDALVEAVLGPQWHDAVPIFSWLALFGLVQPLLHAAGWLFMTQDRTREFFRLAALDCALALAAIAGGLPWGALGVAISYSISGLVVRTPIYLWWAGRSGPVSAMDLARTLLKPAKLAAGVGVAAWLVLPLVASLPALWRLVALALIVGAGVLAMGVSLPAGRRTLRDVVGFIRELRPRS